MLKNYLHTSVVLILTRMLEMFLMFVFYLVAILFIIFDLEAVYFFHWSVSLSFLSLDSFWGMIDFILELVVGFIYAWEVGALEWE